MDPIAMFDPDRYDVVDPSDYEYWDHYELPQDGGLPDFELPQGGGLPDFELPQDGGLPDFGDNLYTDDGNSSAPQGVQDDGEDPDDKGRRTRRELKVAMQRLDQVMSSIPGIGTGLWQGDAETNGQEILGIGQGSAETNGQEIPGIGQGSAETNGQEIPGIGQGSAETNGQEIPGIGQGSAETNGQETEKENAVSDDGLNEAMDEAMDAQEKAENFRLMYSLQSYLAEPETELEKCQKRSGVLKNELDGLKKYTKELKRDLAAEQFRTSKLRARCSKAEEDAEARCKDMEAKLQAQTEEGQIGCIEFFQGEAQYYVDGVKAEAEAAVKELKDSQAAQAETNDAQAKEIIELRQQIANANVYYSETQPKLQELQNLNKDQVRKNGVLEAMLEHQKCYRNVAEAEVQELKRMRDEKVQADKAQAEYIQELEQKLENELKGRTTTQVELEQLRSLRDEKVQADKAQAEYIQELEQKLENELKGRTTTQVELEQLRSLRDKKIEDDKAQAKNIQKHEQRLENELKDRTTTKAELEQLRSLRDKKFQDDKAQAENIQKLEQKLEHELQDRTATQAELQQLRDFRDKKVDADTAHAKNTQKLEQQIENLKEQLSVEQARAANAGKLSSGADHHAAAVKSLEQAMDELKRDHKDSLSKAQNTCEESKAELEDMTKLKEANDTSVKNQTERIVILEHTVAEKDKAIQKLRNDTSTKTREQMGKDIEELRAELAVVRESEKNQLSQNQQIVRDNTKKEKYIEGTDRALKVAKDNLATEKKHHKETVDKLKKTEARMQAKDKELGEVNIKAETTEKKLKDVKGQLKALNSEVKSIEDVKRELAAVTKEKNMTENELLLLEKDFENTKAEYIKLNDEFDVLKKKKEAVEHEVKTQQEVDGGSTKPALEKTFKAPGVPNNNLQASEHIEPHLTPTESLQPPQQQDLKLTRTYSSDLASELMSAAGDGPDSSSNEQVQGNSAQNPQAVDSKTVGGLIGPNAAPEAAPKMGNIDGESSEVGAAAKRPDIMKKPQAVDSGTASGLIGPNSTPEAAPKVGNKEDGSSKVDAALRMGKKNGQSAKVKASAKMGNKAGEFSEVGAALKRPDIAKKPQAVGSGTAGGLIGPNSTPEAAPNTGKKDGESPKVGTAAKPSDVAKKPQTMGSGTVGGSDIPSPIPAAASKTDNKNGGLDQAPTFRSSGSGTSAKNPSSFTSFLPSSTSEYSIPAKWAFLIFLIWIFTMLWASTSIVDARKERNMWLAANDITMRAVISHRDAINVGRGIPGYATGMEAIGWFWHDSVDGVQAGRTFG